MCIYRERDRERGNHEWDWVSPNLFLGFESESDMFAHLSCVRQVARFMEKFRCLPNWSVN